MEECQVNTYSSQRATPMVGSEVGRQAEAGLGGSCGDTASGWPSCELPNPILHIGHSRVVRYRMLVNSCGGEEAVSLDYAARER
jgi:hypothetical protein